MKRLTLNIGQRQAGRLRAPSIIDCDESTEAILRGLKKALSSDFRSLLPTVVSPYGGGSTAPKIKTCLKEVLLPENCLMKSFYDLKGVH